MEDNLYDPPNCDLSATSPTGRSLFSDEGIQIAGSLSRWMRIVGGFYLVSAVLGGIACGVVGVTLGGWILLLVPIGLVLCGLTALGAVWLREAGEQLSRGTAAHDTSTLGAGFSNLRKVFILVGISVGLNVALTMLGVVGEIL